MPPHSEVHSVLAPRLRLKILGIQVELFMEDRFVCANSGSRPHFGQGALYLFLVASQV